MIEASARTRPAKGYKTDAPPPPKTEGLDPLDRERAASVADEGGSAAARVEQMESSSCAKPSDRRSGASDPRGRVRRRPGASF